MPGSNERWQIQPSDILWEDESIIAVNKPAGIPSQPTPDRSRDNCYDAVCRYLRSKYGDKAYAGLHHRLDVATSGVILLTSAQAANRAISEQFQNHTIQKTYCAVCIADDWRLQNAPCRADLSGSPFEIDAPIGEVPEQKIQKFCVGGKHRKSAHTGFICESCIQLRDGCLCVFTCSPHTGRTHQIRVHLSACGLPIVGDSLYGMPLLRSLRSIDPRRMCLHAESIAFIHPTTNVPIKITAPRPREFTSFIVKAGRLAKPS